MCCTALGWMVVNFKVSMYKDDWSYMSLNGHHLVTKSVKQDSVNR